MVFSFPLPTCSTCALSTLSQASRTITLPRVVAFSASMLAGHGDGTERDHLHVLCAHTEVSTCEPALLQLPHWSEAWLGPLSAHRPAERGKLGQHGELL